MQYLPRPDLPRALVRALTESDDDYQKGLDEYFTPLKGTYDYAVSATKLPSPPRPYELTKRHPQDVWVDPVQLLWSLKGSLLHSIIERMAPESDLAEKRIGKTAQLTGFLPDNEKLRVHFHGQLDLFDEELNTLFDFKYVSPMSLTYDEKWEYDFQLNMLAVLYRINYGKSPARLCNVFVSKDWRKRDYHQFKDKGYPPEPIHIAEKPFWDARETKKHMVELAKKHYHAQFVEDDDLPECSPNQQWRNDPSYKLHTVTAKGVMSTNARKVFDTAEAAMEYKDTEYSDLETDQWEIREKKCSPTRCLEWCSVNGLCNQHQREKLEENL